MTKINTLKMNIENFEDFLTKIDNTKKESVYLGNDEWTYKSFEKEIIRKKVTCYTKFVSFFGECSFNGFHAEVRQDKNSDKALIVLTKYGRYVANFYKFFKNINEIVSDETGIERTFAGIRMCNFRAFNDDYEFEQGDMEKSII